MNAYEWYCESCGTVTDKCGSLYDQYGRTLRYWNYLSEYGYINEYDEDCNYVQYNMNEDGSKGYKQGSGINHVAWYNWYNLTDSCTQYNLQYRHCDACDLYEYTENGSPLGHWYEYDEGKDLYRCTRCGLINETSAEARFTIEDLTYSTKEGEYGQYKAGFFNDRCVYEFHIVANHGADGAGIVLNDVAYNLFYYRPDGSFAIDDKCGIVVIDMESLDAAIEKLSADGITVEHISVVFMWADPMSGAYDEETGWFEGSYIEEALTFDPIGSSEPDYSGSGSSAPETCEDPESTEEPSRPEEDSVYAGTYYIFAMEIDGEEIIVENVGGGRDLIVYEIYNDGKFAMTGRTETQNGVWFESEDGILEMAVKTVDGEEYYQLQFNSNYTTFGWIVEDGYYYTFVEESIYDETLENYHLSNSSGSYLKKSTQF